MYSLLKSSSPCRAEYLLQYPIRKDIFVISVIFSELPRASIKRSDSCVCVFVCRGLESGCTQPAPFSPHPNSKVSTKGMKDIHCKVSLWTWPRSMNMKFLHFGICLDIHLYCRTAACWFVRATKFLQKGLWQTFMCKNWVALWTETGYPGALVLLLLWYPGKPAFCLHPLSRPS